MNIKFGVFWKQNLGTIYKDNSITTLGKEADVDLNLSEVSSIHANFKVDGKNYTSIVYIVDIEKGLIRIPFTREVLSIGMHELELVAVMKNGDVIPSQTFTYNIVESLDNLEDITEETNYPILIQLLQDVNSKIAEIDDAIARIPSPEELKGEKGDKGDKGEQGIQGERGLQGIQGIRGEKGDKGDRGLQGIQGAKGEKGDKGERGERGLQGIQGNQGARGIQGEKGDKGETGVGLGFEWTGTKLGIKKDTDISYKYVELKGAKGEQGAKGEKGDTPSISHLETQIANKSKELDTKFEALTSKQQQDAEVVTARDGEVSLHARLERDLEKGKIHFAECSGEYISTESEEGYLENVEIHGNTWQDANNLSDIRSVGTKVEGQELYEIDVVSCGKNLFDGELEKGSISSSTGELTNNDNIIRSKNYIRVNSGGDLSFSSNHNKADIQYVVEYDINKNFLKYTTVFGKLTLSDQTKYIKFRSQTNGVNGYILPTSFPKIQLEEGTQATPYEPYQEDKLTILSPTPLEKVGDVADRIICKDGVWGVEKNIDEVYISDKLITNEPTSKGSVGLKLAYVTYKDLGLNGYSYIIPLSNKFKRLTGNEYVAGSTVGIYGTGGNFDFVLPTSCDTLEKAKNLINGTIVKYATNTPQFIPLPNSQQVKLRTFVGRTNIHFETEIEPTLKAQVPKSLGATVNTHTSQIDNLNKELDRVKKLEESTVSTVTSDKAFTTIAETNQGYFEDVKIEGKTLVNLCKNPINFTGNSLEGTTSKDRICSISLSKNTVIDNTYTVILNITKDEPTKEIKIHFENDTKDSNAKRILETGNHIFTIKANAIYNTLLAYGLAKSGITYTIKDVVILEGDHTDKDISYFEGLKSVGQDTDEISVSSVNENLLEFDSAFTSGVTSWDSANLSIDVVHNISSSSNLCKVTIANNSSYHFLAFKTIIRKGVSYSYKFDSTSILGNSVSLFKDLSSTRGQAIGSNFSGTFVANDDYNYIALPINREVSAYSVSNFILAKDTQITEYTPHKSNKKQILYYNPTTQTWEKPILREWDSIEKHSDGKYYYHKRSGEVTLSEKGSYLLENNDNYHVNVNRFKVTAPNYVQGVIIVDKIKVENTSLVDYEVCISGGSGIYINILKSKAQDVEGFKTWLKTNNITVVYQLAQEEVYGCTNLDLITYNGETNLIVNSGAIQPKITLKVLSNVSNVVKLLQEKVSILENKFIKGLQQVLAGDMMSLAHLLYPEDFENNHEIQTLEL